MLLRYLTIDPVNLSIKAKLLSAVACFGSIFFVTIFTKIFFPVSEYPMLVASMGASAIILFFIPSSPLAQPWPVVGGQLFSALVGVSCALHIAEIASASAAAVGVSVLVMLLLRCLHPPAAATALTPVLAGDALHSLGYSFVLIPVGINIISLLILSIIINRWVMGRSYPSPLPIEQQYNQRHTISQPVHQVGISEHDLELALKNMDVFVDMTHADLSKLLTQAEMNTFKRIRGNMSCADIMVKNVSTVEYGTEIEDAWKLMHHEKLKAVPVVDNAHRVIGIITWNDFFKFIDLGLYDSIQEKFRHFIRRTANLTATKPEAVGLVMTSTVIVLPETTHIAELIPLMSIHGHRQIPIVNAEQRLVGMVYQANLIASLYNEKLSGT